MTAEEKLTCEKKCYTLVHGNCWGQQTNSEDINNTIIFN